MGLPHYASFDHEGNSIKAHVQNISSHTSGAGQNEPDFVYETRNFVSFVEVDVKKAITKNTTRRSDLEISVQET
jgi:hypothetical protein